MSELEICGLLESLEACRLELRADFAAHAAGLDDDSDFAGVAMHARVARADRA